MRLRTEFSVSRFCWIMWFVSWMNHSVKPMLFLFLLMLIHEAAHCFAAKRLNVLVSKITIYPFGLCAVMNTLCFQPMKVQLIILFSGLLVHLVAFFILYFLLSIHWISIVFFSWCWKMNVQLLFFNSLPIFPLDGSSILRVFLCKIMPYRKALKCHLGISLGMLILFFGFYFPTTPASILVFMGLLGLNLNEIRMISDRIHDAKLYQLRRLETDEDFYLV